MFVLIVYLKLITYNIFLRPCPSLDRQKTDFGHEFAVVGKGMNSNQVILVGERGRRCES